MTRATPLTPAAYRPYGDVVAPRPDASKNPANQGTAERFNFLAKLENKRQTAQPNVCIFSCKPTIAPGQSTFDIRVLERHPESTQLFVPMHGIEQYLVIVALGAEAPDPKTVRAFLATGLQGITYLPGVWHHPLVAIDRQATFACLVWEDGSQSDCEEIQIDPAIRVEVR